ncbi:MAG: hypothetical protein GOP50_05605 [Candidatus Heimdallarchaeota archaeon]|nr:hypothetical protein [Candidatus Heimdallarchaeota archaeon]
MLCNSTTDYHLLFNRLFVFDSFSSQANNESDTDYFKGYNLFVLETCDRDDWIFNKSLIIADLEGNIYFQKVIGTDMVGLEVSPEFINSTTILYSDSNGANLWNFETDEVVNLNIFSHHDLERNYAYDSYFSLSHYTVSYEDEQYLYDIVYEHSSSKELLWFFRTDLIVSPDQWCVYQGMSGDRRDLTHTNTVIYDEVDDSIYLQMRHVNSFYKIDHKTMSLIWSLGEYSNFTQYDINGQLKDILFYHAHALEKVNDNTYILFDNDQHNQTDALDQASRLLEITVDEERMIANVTWDWIAPKEYFCKIWGDCDLLPNGNFQGTFGTHNHPDTNLGARLVEVNRNGEIVWKMDFARTPNETYGIYQTDRFRFAPIVSEPRLVKEQTHQYVEWDVWYNFRAKTEFSGKYYITVDGTLVETDQITFPRYWQSTNVRYYLNDTDDEIEEISLVVEDEAGHLSNDTDKYSSVGTLNIKKSRIALILGTSIGGAIFLGVLTYISIRFFKKKKRI